MSKVKIVLSVILAVALGTAIAQSEGIHAQLLKTALAAVAKGECPSSIMSPLLRGTCEQQQPNMGKNLSQRGNVTGVEFLGMQQSQMGPAEAYRVKYQQGVMMWMINTGSDGKIQVFWSPG